MKTFAEELKARLAMLEAARVKALKLLENAPDGSLRICVRGKYLQYYQVRDSHHSHGVYIPKANFELVRALARKSYGEKLLKRIDREKQFLEQYIEVFADGSPEELYDEIGKVRQALVPPILLTEKTFAELWGKQPYKTSDYLEKEKIHETKKGEKVRSKSEVLFANMYFDMGIPYRYEQEIVLADGSKKTPDFTLLDVKNKRLIYHEHFGRMDDDDYRERNLRKIDEYRRNGIFVGKNLLLTFEGKGAILNMREMQEMVRELF
ncbi:MAG: hypothetical protein J5750_04815 [Clostridiales bacterium]|nr:hypothetical protein [Clostridiales bacterium]